MIAKVLVKKIKTGQPSTSAFNQKFQSSFEKTSTAYLVQVTLIAMEKNVKKTGKKKKDRRPHLTSGLQTVHQEREKFVHERVFNVYLIMKIKIDSGFHTLFLYLVKTCFPCELIKN